MEITNKSHGRGLLYFIFLFFSVQNRRLNRIDAEIGRNSEEDLLAFKEEKNKGIFTG